MIYTGIGSRETPEDIQSLMFHIATGLGSMGYTLRSGGAGGADHAFEMGARFNNSPMEIILPWDRFKAEGVVKHVDYKRYYLVPEKVLKAATEIAAQYHPAWDRLSEGARKLHTRNVAQVLGLDLKTPTDFVVCWTSDGKASGGTGQALRIALDYNIPIYNLYNESDFNDLMLGMR